MSKQSQNSRQLVRLVLCVLISAPLVIASYLGLNGALGEASSAWIILPGCLAFWSILVGLGIQSFERLPLEKFLIEGIGLGFLAACVTFLLASGAMFFWAVFFFVS